MKHPPFKVVAGRFTTFHKTEHAALVKAMKEQGRAYRHNPFAEETITDETGVWELLYSPPDNSCIIIDSTTTLRTLTNK